MHGYVDILSIGGGGCHSFYLELSEHILSKISTSFIENLHIEDWTVSALVKYVFHVIYAFQPYETVLTIFKTIKNVTPHTPSSYVPVVTFLQ